MEAISLDALVGNFFRQGKPPGQVGLGHVKAGIEAGDLRKIRIGGLNRADAREIVGLVQRRERAQRLQLRDYGIGNANRPREYTSAMNDAMSRGDQLDRVFQIF